MPAGGKRPDAGKPKGKPKTGGRQKGTRNKITVEIKDLAQNYGPEAIKKLVKLMRGDDAKAERLIDKLVSLEAPDANLKRAIVALVSSLERNSPQTQLSAAKELLDRGYGKATQPLTITEEEMDRALDIVEEGVAAAGS